MARGESGGDKSGHMGTNDHTASLFRVGDNVELIRVLGMVSILVVFIMLLERLIHRLEHHLLQYPKYHEMMTKVFGELMILGLIGLGIKILKEATQLDPYSPRMIAFQAADLTIFMVAIALIFQAMIIFVRLRRKNIQVDKAELISTQHLVDHLTKTKLPTWYDRFASLFTYARRPNLKQLTKADIPEVVQIRILRHKFLTAYGLPQSFPFSKYLRQAQDNQISKMIEVQVTTWLLLLFLAWAMDATSSCIHSQFSFVIAYFIFAWTSVVVHMAMTAYLTWAIDALEDAAVETPSTDANRRYQYLQEIAIVETQAVNCELATDAIATMERVQEQHKHNASAHGRTILETLGCRRHTNDEIDSRPRPLRGFSPKTWHFIIMSTLMPNGLFVALFCQCILYQLNTIRQHFNLVFIVMLVLPFILNMFIFQPRILRNFILVSSIVRVDATALGDVIEHFTETVQLRAEFVDRVQTFLDAAGLRIDDLEHEFEVLDCSKTGYLNADDVRLVLQRFGFQLSFFRFNSVAKLLFEFHGITIEYSQILRLLEIGERVDVRAFATGEPTVMSQEIVSLETKRASQRTLLRATSSGASALYLLEKEEMVSSPTTHYVANV